MSAGDIMIIGGYGSVGEVVAGSLSRRFPGRVLIAGRDGGRTEQCAERVGSGARGRELDAADATAVETALAGVGAVVMCADQDNASIAAQCLGRGTNYLDVTADGGAIKRIAELDSLARQNDASAVVSVGAAPGLTNLLAAEARERLGDVGELEIALLLGAGDAHGPAAIGWTLDNLDQSFAATRDRRPELTSASRESRRFRFPASAGGEVSAIPFDFPEQRSLPLTLDVPTVSSWLAIRPAAATQLLRVGSRLKIGSALRARPRVRDRLIRLAGRLARGSDVCAIAVRASGPPSYSGERKILEMALVGRGQATLTGSVAAGVARLVLSGDVASGVWHLEQIAPLAKLLSALRRELADLTLEVIT